jgi:hypothetical protein
LDDVGRSKPAPIGRIFPAAGATKRSDSHLAEAEVMSDGKVQAALVAALVTLSVALLGEMFLRLRERRVRLRIRNRRVPKVRRPTRSRRHRPFLPAARDIR